MAVTKVKAMATGTPVDTGTYRLTLAASRCYAVRVMVTLP